jgi:hypothetical protein
MTAAFPPMIKAFGGDTTVRGNTGPFWIGSGMSIPGVRVTITDCWNAFLGLAILSAIATFFLIEPLSHDGMEKEDIAFRAYLEEHGFDTSTMGLLDELPSSGSLESVKEKGDTAKLEEVKAVEV